VEISLATLCGNFSKISAAVAPCAVIGVLKANAYGLGVSRIAEALAKTGIYGFGVAELEEALALRSVGLPVQILGGVLPDEIPEAVDSGVVMPITDYRSACMISEESVKRGKTALCHFLIDTGMGRLGILAEHAVAEIIRIVDLPALRCEGIYSHFPMAYSQGSEFTDSQIDRFIEILAVLKDRGIEFRWRHIANSDAINNFPRAYEAPFNAVRTGINLHGSFDVEGRRALSLEPVLTLKTRVASVRTLPAGANIGYGCTYRLPKETAVATISAGYADGLPLALSNRGHVIIRGKPCQVLGRVSMDYTTVSLDQAPDVECGDEVTCLGGHGANAVSVEDWAALKGTHSYEIICSLGTRVRRCVIA